MLRYATPALLGDLVRRPTKDGYQITNNCILLDYCSFFVSSAAASATAKSIARCKDSERVEIRRSTIINQNYLELLSQLRGVALRVNLQHLLIGERKLINRDGGLPAQTGLQDGVVDKHVLLLRDKRGRGGKKEKRRVNLQSHTNRLMRLPTVNCALVKNNAEFNYCCRTWTSGCSRRLFVTLPRLFFDIVSEHKIVLRREGGRREKKLQKLHIAEGDKKMK